MFNFYDISIQYNSSPVTIIAAFVALFAFSYWIYRITIPRLNKLTKWFLLSLRALILILLLLLIFEPVILLKTIDIIKPEIFVFADNSGSIKTDSESVSIMHDVLSDLNKSSLSNSIQLFKFSDSVKLVSDEFLPDFSGRTTDFYNISDELKKSEKNIAATIIISDGIITSGSDPVNTIENLSFPVFTVGLGDTNKKKDISILNVIYSNTVLSGSSADFLVSLEQTGFNNESATISFFEDNLLIEEKTLVLKDNGVNTQLFSYKPKNAGDKKIAIKIKELPGETNIINNTKTFYLKVLENKNNVLIIAGAPHPDVSFIKNSLQIDTSLKINAIVQLTPEKYLSVSNIQPLIDSAGTLFLIGFPSNKTSDKLIESVKASIRKGTPYFIIINPNTDYSKLRNFEESLPFTVLRAGNGTMQVQPAIQINQLRNPIISNSDLASENSWENLPPVSALNWEIKAKAESEVIAAIKINNSIINSPLLLTRELGSKKSAALLASDIWKWKLQKAKSGSTLFDRFILNLQRWLTITESRKQVRIETNKKIYMTGEKVAFFAEVYDKSFNPISDAIVKAYAIIEGEKTELLFNHVKDGIYSSEFYPQKSGDYTFTGDASIKDIKIGSDNGRFLISKQDVELVNTYINKDLLTLLSSQTKGKFYLNRDYQNLLPELENLLKKTSSEKIKSFEYALLANEYFMMLLIFFFGIEWFIRKRNGLQ